MAKRDRSKRKIDTRSIMRLELPNKRRSKSSSSFLKDSPDSDASGKGFDQRRREAEAALGRSPQNVLEDLGKTATEIGRNAWLERAEKDMGRRGDDIMKNLDDSKAQVHLSDVLGLNEDSPAEEGGAYSQSLENALAGEASSIHFLMLQRVMKQEEEEKKRGNKALKNKIDAIEKRLEEEIDKAGMKGPSVHEAPDEISGNFKHPQPRPSRGHDRIMRTPSLRDALQAELLREGGEEDISLAKALGGNLEAVQARVEQQKAEEERRREERLREQRRLDEKYGDPAKLNGAHKDSPHRTSRQSYNDDLSWEARHSRETLPEPLSGSGLHGERHSNPLSGSGLHGERHNDPLGGSGLHGEREPLSLGNLGKERSLLSGEEAADGGVTDSGSLRSSQTYKAASFAGTSYDENGNMLHGGEDSAFDGDSDDLDYDLSSVSDLELDDYDDYGPGEYEEYAKPEKSLAEMVDELSRANVEKNNPERSFSFKSGGTQILIVAVGILAAIFFFFGIVLYRTGQQNQQQPHSIVVKEPPAPAERDYEPKHRHKRKAVEEEDDYDPNAYHVKPEDTTQDIYSETYESDGFSNSDPDWEATQAAKKQAARKAAAQKQAQERAKAKEKSKAAPKPLKKVREDAAGNKSFEKMPQESAAGVMPGEEPETEDAPSEETPLPDEPSEPEDTDVSDKGSDNSDGFAPDYIPDGL
ncbi:MAG: hypothetical protein K6G50_08375 [bacterium]|nr:hypothetical protein [bacterium]